jgi:hypothetical protein
MIHEYIINYHSYSSYSSYSYYYSYPRMGCDLSIGFSFSYLVKIACLSSYSLRMLYAGRACIIIVLGLALDLFILRLLSAICFCSRSFYIYSRERRRAVLFASFFRVSNLLFLLPSNEEYILVAGKLTSLPLYIRSNPPTIYSSPFNLTLNNKYIFSRSRMVITSSINPTLRSLSASVLADIDGPPFTYNNHGFIFASNKKS